MPAPQLIDTALQLLLSGAKAPDRSTEAQNKAAGRAGLGWPPDRSETAPTVADLLPRDMQGRFLEVWLTTGTNVLFTQAISLLATLEDGGSEAVKLISESLEADIWQRVETLAAKWEGGSAQ
ncbi:MAG: hypothetical protein JWM59_1858 [Verrucomicrobiales bacterium]|nr:hypothetical protein [Verrucomicrobiales bacterium]